MAGVLSNLMSEGLSSTPGPTALRWLSEGTRMTLLKSAEIQVKSAEKRTQSLSAFLGENPPYSKPPGHLKSSNQAWALQMKSFMLLQGWQLATMSTCTFEEHPLKTNLWLWSRLETLKAIKYGPNVSALKSQIAITTISRRGQITRKFCRSTVIFAQN